MFEGAQVNFGSQKIVVREKGDAVKHAYTNADMALTVTAPATNARTNLSANQFAEHDC